MATLREGAPALALLLAGALLGAPAQAAAVDDGRLFFAAGGSGGTTPSSDPFDRSTKTFGVPAPTLPGGSNETFFVVKASSTTSAEYLAGYVTSGGRLYVLRYDGAAWSAAFDVLVGGDGVNGRRFDIAYEKTSGRGIVVYSGNVSTSGQQLRYRVWTPATINAAGSWGSAQAFGSARLTGVANQVKLTSRPGASEVAAAVADTSSRLTTLILNGSTWGSEPAAALTTGVNYVTTAGDLDAYDLAYSRYTGDLFVAWADKSNSVVLSYRFQRSSNGWLGANGLSSYGVSPYHVVVAADPLSDQIGVVWSQLNPVGLGSMIWTNYYYLQCYYSGCPAIYPWQWVAPMDGTTLITSIATPTANSRQFAAFWFPSPGASFCENGSSLMVPYQESSGTAGRISYGNFGHSGSGGFCGYWGNCRGWNLATLTASVAWTGSSSKRWIQAENDLADPRRAMVVFSDSNNSLWAKNVSYPPAYWCPVVTFSDADGGTPLSSTLSTTSAPAFSFDYSPPYILIRDNLGTEADTGTTTCASSNALYDVDHFALATTFGTTDTVSQVTVNVTAGANAISTIYVTSDDGHTIYGSLPNPVTGNNLIPLTQSMPITSAPTQYRVQVMPALLSALPGGVDYTITATVATVTTTSTLVAGGDATSGSVVVDRTPPAPPTWAAPPFNTVLNQGLQVNMSWTNPGPPWVNTVILRGVDGGDMAASSLTDGNTYALGGSSGTDTVAYVGTGTNATDQTAVGRYYYRAFAADRCLNYSTSAISPTPAAPNPTTAVGLTGAPSGCGVLTLVASYAGDGNNDDSVAFTANGSPITCSILPARDTRLATWTCTGVVPLNATYNCAATFTDPDGVSGTNPVTFQVNGSGCGMLSLAAHPSGASPAATAAPGQTNVLAGRFQLTAAIQSVYVNQIALTNTGTATAADIAAVNVYADTGSTIGSWDPGDQLVATAHYSPAANAWVVSGFTQALGTTRYLVTIGAAYGAVTNDTFAIRFSPTSISVPFPNSVTGTTPTLTGGTVTISGSAKGQPPGDASGNSKKPMVLVLNPAAGATLSLGSPGNAVRVQVQVFDPSHSTVTSVALSHDGGTSFPDGLTRNATYDPTVNPNGPPYYAGVYQADLTTIPAGSWTLQAKAMTSGGGTGYSSPIVISVNPAGVGDGNLLSRNDSSQLCIDCHTVQTHSAQASASVRTGLSKYGSWGVSCRDCHAPHKSRNAQLVRESIVPPAYSTYQSAKAVRFWDRRTGDSGTSNAVSFVTSSTTLTSAGTFGSCQVCHTRTANVGGTARWRNTGNSDTHFAGAGTQRCTYCHSHLSGFTGRESIGGEYCGTCHGGMFNAMQAGARLSRHTLGPSPLGSNGSYLDSDTSWAGPLASTVPAASRSCVNMCHGDHVHNDPAAWPAQTHANNFYLNPTTQASRALSRDTGSTGPTYGYATSGSTGSGYLKTDYVPGQTTQGCIACHVNPVDSSRPAIDGPAYEATGHAGTSTPGGATWEYVLHDDSRGGTPSYDSRFTRNCTKCHAGTQTEGRTVSYAGSVQGVHYSDNPSLLGGPVAGSSICFNCHGNGTTGRNYSNKDVASRIQGASYHPVSADAAHSTVSESTATFASGAYTGAKRHVNCLDCHGPHVAGKTKVARGTAFVADANRNQIPPGSPLLGASGIRYGPGGGKSYPALPAADSWLASTAGSYGDTTVAQAIYEYEVCFKCHTAFAYGGTSASGTGFGGPTNAGVAGTSGQGETDLGMEFSPTMRSGHPVVAALESYTGPAVPQGLGNDRLLPPWNTNSGKQTMLCTDCHDNDSAAPAVQGPHGSAYPFMLAGANKSWPATQGGTAWFTLGTDVYGYQVVGSEYGLGTPDGLFCRNCHPTPATVSAWTWSGTNWAHKYSGVGHGGGKCVWCHLAIPHGGKVDRLIVTSNAPPRYMQNPSRWQYGDPIAYKMWDGAAIKSFRKGSTPFSGQKWSPACVDPDTGQLIDHSDGSAPTGQLTNYPEAGGTLGAAPPGVEWGDKW